MNILQAIADPNVFQHAFAKSPSSWRAWYSFLAALFGLKLSKSELEIFKACTGRDMPPPKGVREAVLICGRRSGKSFVLALIAVFLAIKDYRKYLAAGERATVVVIAADRRQARTIMRYVTGLLKATAMLENAIKSESVEAIDLDNRVTIEVHTASWRSVRGYTVAAALCDELAFWRSEDSANPDHEIIAALRPAMATIPSAMLLCASSPYSRRGVLWDSYNRHYGKNDSDVLVWKADTRTMNPSVPQSFIDAEVLKDPASAAAEYGADFRRDIEAFISREAVQACVIPGLRERAPSGYRYVAFTDPSGGSSDSFTLAIAHREQDVIKLDCIRERKPPFSPEACVQEFCEVLKSYSISRVEGDHYAGLFPRELFKKRGITYATCETPKSDLYRDMLPLINSNKVELLENARLVSQLSSLERRTARSGKDSIDHAPGAGAHDDVANAAAGAIAMVSAKGFKVKITAAALEWARRPYSGFNPKRKLTA